MTGERFRDRREAGRLLGEAVAKSHAAGSDTIVLGLPRGGVPVADEVARAIGAALDVFVVRKLGLPGHEELAIGAIASGGVRVLNSDVLSYYPVPAPVIERIARRQEEELLRREQSYRGNRPPIAVEGKTVIVVDDGLATGATMRAAVEALRKMRAGRIVVAVPVGAPSTCRELANRADDVICLRAPEPFEAVGLWYEDFDQTSDAEVQAILNRGPAGPHGGGAAEM